MPRKSHHTSSVGLPAIIAALIGFAIVFVALFRFGGLFSQSDFAAFDRFTVVAATPKDVHVLSFNFKTRSLSDVRFPSDVYIPELTHGYGSYLLDKVYSVGQLDNRGGEVLRSTMREFVGVPIEGYVISSNPIEFDSKNALLSPAFLFQDPSNLSFLDRLRFAWAVSQVRNDHRRNFDVGEAAQDLVLPDGSNAKAIEKDSLDVFLGSAFVEESLQDEHLRVEVVNSTPYPGLGNRASRILTALGGSVVMVNSQENQVKKCLALFDPAVKNSQTLKRIGRLFDCETKQKGSQDRAEITVVLGEAYVGELTK